MIRASGARGEESLQVIVVVAFHRTTGEVYGTYVHGSLTDIDSAEVRRGGERLCKDTLMRLGESDDIVDLMEVPLDEVPATGIARVDPGTRRLEVATYPEERFSRLDRA